MNERHGITKQNIGTNNEPTKARLRGLVIGAMRALARRIDGRRCALPIERSGSFELVSPIQSYHVQARSGYTHIPLIFSD